MTRKLELEKKVSAVGKKKERGEGGGKKEKEERTTGFSREISALVAAFTRGDPWISSLFSPFFLPLFSLFLF